MEEKFIQKPKRTITPKFLILFSIGALLMPFVLWALAFPFNPEGWIFQPPSLYGGGPYVIDTILVWPYLVPIILVTYTAPKSILVLAVLIGIFAILLRNGLRKQYVILLGILMSIYSILIFVLSVTAYHYAG